MAVENRPNIFSQLAQFNQLPMQQRIGLMIAIAAIIAIVAGGWMWSQAPDYKVLYSNLSDRDGGAIIASLQQMNVPYKFAEGGGALLVPGNQVHEVRLRLASQGLPKGSLVGFELMENQKFGISQFQEQVNYQRGLEGELARTIQSISSVQGARVHLAIPKPSVFIREQEKPSASVLLDLYPGKVIDPGQVNAITHLISSSVAELSPKNVTVVDQNGNLLSQSNDLIAANGMNPGQLKYLQDVEKSYIKHIEDILTPMVGPSNVRAQVTADIDFARIEATSESYRPNQAPGSASVRSTQTQETLSSSPQGAIGVPGALSNQPPGPTTAVIANQGASGAAAASAVAAASMNTHKEATTNFEVDKTISHTTQSVGGVKRLSVAVVINYRKSVDAAGKESYKPLSPQEIKQINDLVKEAVGYSQARGDSVNVVNTAFNTGSSEAIPSLPWYKQPELISMITSIGKTLLVGAVVLYLIIGVIRPAFLNLKLQAEARAAEAAKAAAEIPLTMPKKPSQESTIQAAKDLAKENPQLVANVIKGWVAGNE